MKIFKSIVLVAAVFATFLSCQKELAFDNSGASAGLLKKDASGNCLPVTVNGIFKKDSVLTNTNFVDVQVNISFPGTFDIKSDTVNGYSFSKTGSVVLGTNTIRLYAAGKPIAEGLNTFTVKYGTSTCSFNITIPATPPPPADYTLGNTMGACTGAIIGGTYSAGILLTSANTLTVQVNVISPGAYTISTSIVNGFKFTGTGIFTSAIPALQNVTLTASGTPTVAGTTNVTVTTNATTASTCSFDIPVGVAPVTTGDYFPLTANSWWSYDYSDFGVPMPDTLSMTAITTKTYNGNTYRELAEAEGGFPTDTLHYRKSGNDYFQWVPTDMYSAVFAFDVQTYADINILKENAATNTTWSSGEYTGTVGGLPAKVKYDFKIENANTSLTINSIVYTNVIQVGIVMQASIAGFPYTAIQNSNYYYAKGIGPIKIIHTLTGGSPIGERTIRNYKIF